MFTAFLDACVLLPVALADTLLRTAEHGLFRPRWSPRVLDEVRRAFTQVRPDLDSGRLEYRLREMDRAFPDASVGTAWSAFPLSLPDADDEHVLRSALSSGADVLVTANLQDFPDEALHPLGIDAVGPDAFLLDQIDLSLDTMVAVVRGQAAAARRPSRTAVDVLDALARAGVPRFADEMRSLVS